MAHPPVALFLARAFRVGRERKALPVLPVQARVFRVPVAQAAQAQAFRAPAEPVFRAAEPPLEGQVPVRVFPVLPAQAQASRALVQLQVAVARLAGPQAVESAVESAEEAHREP